MTVMQWQRRYSLARPDSGVVVLHRPVKEQKHDWLATNYLPE